MIDARTIQKVSPGVQITQESGRLQVNIRDVMSIHATERGDPSNAFNIDRMSVGRPEAQFASFLDVQRVEVLRGPQGTLYGRNATGGAVNVISNKPGNKLGGKLSLELGNYSAKRGEAAIDVPVNSLLKLRAAVNANKRDSLLNGPAGIGLEDQDDMAARVHGQLTFSKDTSLLLTAECSKINSNGFTPVAMSNFYTGTFKGGNATWYNDLNATLVVDWTGQQLDRAPKTTARLGYTHTFELGDGSAIEAGAVARYNSGYLMSSYGNDYATRYRQPAFTKYDAQISWRSADDKYGVQVYGKNLSDEITVENRVPSAVNVAAPRTFGVRVNARF